jgi:hypothetical protein
MAFLILIPVLLLSFLILAFWITFGIAARRFPIGSLPWILAYLTVPPLLYYLFPLLPFEPDYGNRSIADMQVHAMKVACLRLVGDGLLAIIVAAAIVKVLPDDPRKDAFLRFFGLAYPARHYLGGVLVLIGLAVPFVQFYIL